MKLFNFIILSVILTAGSVGVYGDVCPRFQPGSTITQPEDLYSQNGILMVSFTYDTRVDNVGNVLYCFTNSDGAESPTLHVNPGDKLIVTLKNNLPPSPQITAMKGMDMSVKPDFSVGNTTPCGAAFMTASSVNIHYHGTNTPPSCHQDEVIKTLINGGDTFTYTLEFPLDEPPGLYWYHPHVHGLSDAAVNGGATGVIVVEGIQNWNPALVGLPIQVMVLRDYPIPLTQIIGDDAPFWNISLNYVPVPYPAYQNAIIQMQPLQQQFWRVANTSADTLLDLQVLYDGVPQNVTVVALDGVPVGTDGGDKSFNETDVYLPPATRAEFIVTGPSTSVKKAQVITQYIDTGELGDNTPERPVATIQLTSNSSQLPVVQAVSGPPPIPRFGGLLKAVPNTTRYLYFSELLGTDKTNKLKASKTAKNSKTSKKSSPPINTEPTRFFITVVGQPQKLFSAYNPPAIITTHGSVEDWIIENHAMEPHEFHMHQIHFLTLEVNGVPIPNPQYRDTFEVPKYTGSGPYPSVKLRMDFRGPTIGDFVYHCHILGHEDGGMMATIRVQ